jgi:hypothetical protein
VDLNHRPHAYQACALNQLSYRPGLMFPTLQRTFQRTGGAPKGAVLGPWRLDSKRYADAIVASFESPPWSSREPRG